MWARVHWCGLGTCEHVCVHSSLCTWACMCWCAQVVCGCVCRARVHTCCCAQALCVRGSLPTALHGPRVCWHVQADVTCGQVCCCAQVLRAQACQCRASVLVCGCLHGFHVCKCTSECAWLCVQGVCVQVTGAAVLTGSVRVSRAPCVHALCAPAPHVSPCAHAGWARAGPWLWMHRCVRLSVVLHGETQNSTCVCVCACACAYMFVYPCVCTRMCVYMCLCVHTCVYTRVCHC